MKSQPARMMSCSDHFEYTFDILQLVLATSQTDNSTVKWDMENDPANLSSPVELLSHSSARLQNFFSKSSPRAAAQSLLFPTSDDQLKITAGFRPNGD